MMKKIAQQKIGYDFMDGIPNKQNRHSREVTDSNRQVPPAKKARGKSHTFFILSYSEFSVKK